MRKTILLLLFVIGLPFISEARQADITPATIRAKLREIMHAHVHHKELTEELAIRSVKNYLEILDPSKTYFIYPEVEHWINLSKENSQEVLAEFNGKEFTIFFDIHEKMVEAIERRGRFEEELRGQALVEDVNPKDFRDLDWARDEEELKTRIAGIRSLQLEALEELDMETKELSLQRIDKRRQGFEEEFLEKDMLERQRFILANILKATASALDSHTAYFTPSEAQQFMIHVQQRLFGIGVQLRDDISGFSVVKIIEGGPSFEQSGLLVKDRIIAVDGVPVVGMDIVDAVELIRGEAGIPVKLKVLRDVTAEDGTKTTETVDVKIVRGEVVLKESRIESEVEPYGDGVIARIHLFSFYQDPHNSSASDLAQEIRSIREKHKLKGIILDLRFNSGGMLPQAVAVTGLFISKGIVVSIKDDTGRIQHLRDTDGETEWDGPLIVLLNRASASASEIVAQTLQDYGRALIVGDDTSFGKGTYQTFTLNSQAVNGVNPQGEYKVTRGRYYTVSGRSPQLTGVISDVVVPSYLSAVDIGERFAKFPLENDEIAPNFDDKLEDLSIFHGREFLKLYRFGLQQPTNRYTQYIERLKENSLLRVEKNTNYQTFLKELTKEEPDEEEPADFGTNDLQLQEAYNIMKDLVLLLS
ncbi:MAG: tail-specific protease [Waddliaceae bacterium]|nr:tail-specific protease [Waddliaceae bacterium]